MCELRINRDCNNLSIQFLEFCYTVTEGNDFCRAHKCTENERNIWKIIFLTEYVLYCAQYVQNAMVSGKTRTCRQKLVTAKGILEIKLMVKHISVQCASYRSNNMILSLRSQQVVKATNNST